MKRLLFVLLCAAIFVACGPSGKQETTALPAETRITDSFQVHGIASLSEFLSFAPIGDSMLSSFNQEGIEAAFYKKENGIYQPARRLSMSAGMPTYSVFRDSLHHYIIDGENILHTYDRFFQPQNEQPILYTAPFLKTDFKIVGMNTVPVIKLGDTLIVAYGHRYLQDYDKYFREATLMEFTIGKDSVKDVRHYFSKPSLLRQQHAPFPLYGFVNNRLILAFPGLDSIWVYDRSHKSTAVYAINNRDYTAPTVWDMTQLGKPDYNSYQTKYNLNNFRYEALYYNPDTRHYVLMYEKAVLPKEGEELPTYDDQQMQAVVLDEQFKVLQYYTFEHHYFDPSNYFFIPGKGLAIPRFKSKTEYENTTFYTFNF